MKTYQLTTGDDEKIVAIIKLSQKAAKHLATELAARGHFENIRVEEIRTTKATHTTTVSKPSEYTLRQF